jgi:hypothetical protein
MRAVRSSAQLTKQPRDWLGRSVGQAPIISDLMERTMARGFEADAALRVDVNVHACVTVVVRCRAIFA